MSESIGPTSVYSPYSNKSQVLQAGFAAPVFLYALLLLVLDACGPIVWPGDEKNNDKMDPVGLLPNNSGGGQSLPATVTTPLGNPDGTPGSQFLEGATIHGQALFDQAVGVSNKNLLFVCGTTSSLIPGMPQTVELDGLVNITPSQRTDGGFGLQCNDPDYSAFAFCPAAVDENGNPLNRIPLYLDKAEISCLDKDNNPIALDPSVSQQDYPLQTVLFGTLSQDYTGEESFTFPVPKQCYHQDFGRDGSFTPSLDLTLSVYNRDVNAAAKYLTYLRCAVIEQ